MFKMAKLGSGTAANPRYWKVLLFSFSLVWCSADGSKCLWCSGFTLTASMSEEAVPGTAPKAAAVSRLLQPGSITKRPRWWENNRSMFGYRFRIRHFEKYRTVPLLCLWQYFRLLGYLSTLVRSFISLVLTILKFYAFSMLNYIYYHFWAGNFFVRMTN